MLFLLKVDQKNRANQNNFSKVEKLRDFLNKVRLVVKKLFYVKKYSTNKKIEANSYTITSSGVFPNSRFLDIDLGRFNLKIINDSHPLIVQVKELRQKSFFRNTKTKQSDSDEYDKFCDHLVVIDKSVSDDFVVGTYRLLLKPKLLPKQRFYSESEFDISNLLASNNSTLLEAGRSCVHEHYRDGRIIRLLWRGLATYIINNRVDLIFGCASFPSSNYKLFIKQLSYLYHYHKTPKSLSTRPVKKLRANFNIMNKNKIDIEREFRNLPPLIKAYIRVGAWIGPGAIVDSKFDTTDVLIVLNSKKILKKYAQLSFEKIH